MSYLLSAAPLCDVSTIPLHEYAKLGYKNAREWSLPKPPPTWLMTPTATIAAGVGARQAQPV
jgi:hypothetical protein